MKITVKLQDAEITVEQVMDKTNLVALANEFEKNHILHSVKELVSEVIRLKSQKQDNSATG